MGGVSQEEHFDGFFLLESNGFVCTMSTCEGAAHCFFPPAISQLIFRLSTLFEISNVHLKLKAVGFLKGAFVGVMVPYGAEQLPTHLSGCIISTRNENEASLR